MPACNLPLSWKCLRSAAEARSEGARSNWLKYWILFSLWALWQLPAPAQDIDVAVYSTSLGGGALVAADFDFLGKIRVADRLGSCPGGECFYSSNDPGFRSPAASRPGEGLHALTPGTPVDFEVVALDGGVSFKVGATVLRSAGSSVRLGTATGLHLHPEYQLQTPKGVVGDYSLSFRLTTSAVQYEPSQIYTFVLTNGGLTETSPTPEATPTNTATPPTATPPPTATATPPPAATPTQTVPPNETCDGDCNGDGMVSISELIRGVNIALGNLPVETCSSFDINGDGMVGINELISAVFDALNGC